MPRRPIPVAITLAVRPARVFLLLACLACAQPALAGDEVLVAANGDRLTGRVVERADGWLVFESEAFGRLRVREDAVQVEPAGPVPDAVAQAPAQAPEAPASPWSFELGMKLGADRGSLETRENEADATLRFVRTGDTGELHGNLAYGYTRSDDRLKDDDMSASLSYDRWMSDRYFISGRVIGSSDLVDDGYDVTRTVSAAWGWRLVEGEARYLRIGPAVGYLWIERGPESFNGTAVGLYARAKGPLAWRMTYSGELQLLDSFDDGRYANLDLRVQHPLSDTLQIGLAWRYLWSDVAIDSGISSEWRWEITWRPRVGG